MPMSSTSIKPDRIKASNNRSQNSMVSLFLRITMLARFSPSRFWVDYTTITAEVLKLLRVCEKRMVLLDGTHLIWGVAYRGFLLPFSRMNATNDGYLLFLKRRKNCNKQSMCAHSYHCCC